MSNDLNTFIQLLVLLGWTILLVYSFFRKWQYLTFSIKILLPFSYISFATLNTTLFNVVDFKTDWFAILFYLAQISMILLSAIMLWKIEIKIDAIKDLSVFKKMNEYAKNEIWVMEYETGIMLYSNPSYQKKHKKFDGNKLDGLWHEDLINEYLANNKKAFEAKGEVLLFEERISQTEKEKVNKFFAIVDNRNVIIGISHE